MEGTNDCNERNGRRIILEQIGIWESGEREEGNEQPGKLPEGRGKEKEAVRREGRDGRKGRSDRCHQFDQRQHISLQRLLVCCVSGCARWPSPSTSSIHSFASFQLQTPSPSLNNTPVHSNEKRSHLRHSQRRTSKGTILISAFSNMWMKHSALDRLNISNARKKPTQYNETSSSTPAASSTNSPVAIFDDISENYDLSRKLLLAIDQNSIPSRCKRYS
ncbi:hypothetical protein AB6A40_006551 [Gnathostoma spinigerum]|uniref:Uncharacterized protein n=1 Tax=Gnathostoma spinigerum TaxID=75299 RepID=A0ABD6EKV9_9BILA